MQNLPELSRSTSPQINSDNISVYRGELTTQAVISEVKKIKLAFPGLPAGFYDVFSDRIKDNGFCDDRLRDAVAHVIDNCVYPLPTIAQFISYDKCYKVYTYDQMLEKFADAEMGSDFWKYYKTFQFSNRSKKVWIHIDDVEKYNIKEF